MESAPNVKKHIVTMRALLYLAVWSAVTAAIVPCFADTEPVDKTGRGKRTTRSGFIRKALKAVIRRQSVRNGEMRHAEGYTRQPIVVGEIDVWLSEQDWGVCKSRNLKWTLSSESLSCFPQRRF